jgi:hypothetical protein
MLDIAEWQHVTIKSRACQAGGNAIGKDQGDASATILLVRYLRSRHARARGRTESAPQITERVVVLSDEGRRG